MCPLLTATTFVIKENGVEVGRWVEEDGSSQVEIIGSHINYQKQKSQPELDLEKEADDKKKKNLYWEKKKAIDWGVSRGVTKEEVQALAKQPRQKNIRRIFRQKVLEACMAQDRHTLHGFGNMNLKQRTFIIRKELLSLVVGVPLLMRL